MSPLGNLIGAFAKNLILSQLRTWLPYIGGLVTTLGVGNQVSPASLEGAVYYLVSSALVMGPAIGSYLHTKTVQSLVTAAAEAAPGSPEAASIVAKVV